MKFEQERICQLPHFVESALCARTLLIGAVRFPAGCHDSADQTENDKNTRGNGDLVACNEFRSPITESVFASDDRTAFEVAPNVFRKLVNGYVAALGLF